METTDLESGSEFVGPGQARLSPPMRAQNHPLHMRARTTLPRFHFLFKKKWSAGRRQGACEAPFDEPLREVRPRTATKRIASPSREARASCIDGVAKPTAPTLRLPALHQPRPRRHGAAVAALIPSAS